MYIIGLTGNIATGKSTVAKMLEGLGAYVIDADELAHEVMRAGTAVNRRIVARFGQVCMPDGEIDRRELGALVFSDPKALGDLEEMIHPVVLKETARRLQACSKGVGVVEAIKLLETDLCKLCDAIWAVTSHREQQVERLVRTRGLTKEQALLRIDAQSPVADKVARADLVIDNSGELRETRAQVLRAWNAIPGVIAEPADQPMGDFDSKGRAETMKVVSARHRAVSAQHRAFLAQHPRLVTWLILALGMVLLFLWAAKGRGLLPGQTLFLVLACIGLAGLCTWIIGWES